MQGQILMGGVFPSGQPQFIHELKSHLIQRPDVFVWLMGSTEPGAVAFWASPEIPVTPDHTVQTDISSLHTLSHLCQEHGFPILIQDRYMPAKPTPAMQAAWQELNNAGLGDVPWLVIFACDANQEHHFRFGQFVHEALRRTGHQAVLLAEGTLREQQVTAAEGKIGRIIREATRADMPLVMTLGALKNTRYKVLGSGDGAIFSVEPQLEDATGPAIAAETLPELAMKAIETFLASGEVPRPDTATRARFPERLGTFVNLYRQGAWRGGVGNLHPVENMAQATIRHAIFAATRDPRFGPVQSADLPNLSTQVLILGQPKMVRDITHLDPQIYGLLVSSGYRFGMALPKTEGIDTPNKQITAAMRKGGISAGEPMWLYRFTVQEVDQRATVPSNS